MDTFGEIAEEEKALTKLSALKFSDCETIAEFNSKIGTLFIRAGIQGDQAQKKDYLNKLPDFLLRKLYDNPPLPVTMRELAARVIQLEEAYQMYKQLRPTSLRFQGNRKRQSEGRDKNIRAVGFNSLDQKTRERLMQENRCFHCQEIGHRAKTCPKKPRRFGNKRVPERKTRVIEEDSEKEDEPHLEAIALDIEHSDF